MSDLRSWVKCCALGVRCAIIGHRYDTHFTNLISNMTVEDGEIPWCYRCGNQEPTPSNLARRNVA